MHSKYKKFRNLEEKMIIMGQFFSEYFRKTMVGPGMNTDIDFTILELKGLGAFVDSSGEYTMSELSTNAFLPLPNMTSIIRRFEERGLVTRRRDERDRRVVKVRLTGKGRKLMEKFMETRCAELEKTLGKLSYADQQELFRSLELALNILRKIEY